MKAGHIKVEKPANGEGLKTSEDQERKDRVIVLAETNQERFDHIKSVVDAYLRKCGRQWVEMDMLFSYALK